MTLLICMLLQVISLPAQQDYKESSHQNLTLSLPRKIIIFGDTVKWNYYIIRERDFIRYRLIDSATTLKGKIIKIHHDTLFMKHTTLLPETMDKIASGHSKTPRFNVRRSLVFLIPDSACLSHSKHAWKRSILKYIKTRRVLVRSDTIHSNFIKLNLSRLLRLEIALSYERRISPVVSLELELGYGFPVYDRTPPGNGDLFETFNYFPSEGFSVIAGPRLYRLKQNRPGFYLEPLAIFKDLKYLNTYYPSDLGVEPANSEFYPFGDKYTMVYGASFRIGTIRKYGNVIVDYYAGFGIQVRCLTYHFYGYYDHYDGKHFYYDPPVIQHKTELWPMISLGLKMGLGF